MSNAAKIVIDADNGKVDAANKKTQEGFKQTAREAAKVGSQMDKWGRQLGEKVAGIGAIIGVMRSVGQEVERQRAQAAGASKEIGGGALGRSAAIRELGLDKTATGAAGADAAITGGEGGTTVAQRDALLGALAGQQRASKGKKMKPEVSMRALSLFNTGLYSQEEVLAAAAKGKGALDVLASQTGERFNKLSPQARTELAFTQQERETSNEINALTSSGAARIKERQEDLFTAQNPTLGGLRRIVSENSGGVLPLLESEAVVGKGGSAMLRQQDAILKRIEAAANIGPRPTMSPTTEGGP